MNRSAVYILYYILYYISTEHMVNRKSSPIFPNKAPLAFWKREFHVFSPLPTTMLLSTVFKNKFYGCQRKENFHFKQGDCVAYVMHF